MKSTLLAKQDGLLWSLLSLGAWIEIGKPWLAIYRWMSLLSLGAWIEITLSVIEIAADKPSLLSLGAWIEIPVISLYCSGVIVAPFIRSVD